MTSNADAAPSAPSVGMKVTVLNKGLVGIVRFVGTTKFAEGIWVGIELGQPIGKNDGSVSGVQYFNCGPAKGIFVRPTHVKPFEEVAASPAIIASKQSESPPAAEGDGNVPSAVKSKAESAIPGTSVTVCTNLAAADLFPKPGEIEKREEESKKKEQDDEREEDELDIDHPPPGWCWRRNTQSEVVRGSILVPEEPEAEMSCTVEEAALEIRKLTEIVSRLSMVLDQSLQRERRFTRQSMMRQSTLLDLAVQKERSLRPTHGFHGGLCGVAEEEEEDEEEVVHHHHHHHHHHHGPDVLEAASESWIQETSKRLEVGLADHLQQTLEETLAAALEGPLAQARLAEVELSGSKSLSGVP